jgi:hypothetical protein
VVIRAIKTYRKVGAFYIAWEEDFSTPISRCKTVFRFDAAVLI